MPPWLDWLDWLKWDCIGASVIGKLLGLWFRACATVTRKFFQFVLGSRSGYRSNASLARKVVKVVWSTSLTLLLWVTLTWKPIWISAGPRGERIVAAVLLFITAFWVISLAWICLSKPGRERVFHLASVKSICDKSTNPKTS